MKTGFVVSIQRHLFALLIAVAVTFTALVTPMLIEHLLIEQISSVQLTHTASACSASGGGC